MATPPYLSPPFDLDSDLCSGYLEDALLEFRDRSKRRRLSFSSSSDRSLLPPGGYLNSCTGWATPSWNDHRHCSTWIGGGGLAGFPDALEGISISTSEEEETTNAASEIQMMSEDAMSLSSSLDSSTWSLNPVLPSNPIADAPRIPLVGCPETEKRKKQEVIKGVAYPFALVKPGGSEDDVTLEDINARILMAPTRPVRHPVGDFACRPYGGGPGLSGKAVVGLTRVHTQGGRGSITIIRTKG